MSYFKPTGERLFLNNQIQASATITTTPTTLVFNVIDLDPLLAYLRTKTMICGFLTLYISRVKNTFAGANNVVAGGQVIQVRDKDAVLSAEAITSMVNNLFTTANAEVIQNSVIIGEASVSKAMLDQVLNINESAPQMTVQWLSATSAQNNLVMYDFQFMLEIVCM